MRLPKVSLLKVPKPHLPRVSGGGHLTMPKLLRGATPLTRRPHGGFGRGPR